MFKVDEVDIKLLETILIGPKVHYGDLMSVTGLSKPTIVKRLNMLSVESKKLGAIIVRKRGDGIYVEGDKTELLKIIGNTHYGSEDRKNKILINVLFREEPITLQELADELFVSRDTMQKDFHQVKKTLKENDLYICKSSQGIILGGLEKNRRHLISSIINHIYDSSDGILDNQDKLDDFWSTLLDTKGVKEVQNLMYAFLKKNSIEYNNYKFKNLVIHVLIMIERVKSGSYLAPLEHNTENYILTETNSLVGQLENKFKIKLNDNEVAYLNSHIESLEDTGENGRTSKNMDKVAEFIKSYLSDMNHDQLLIEELTSHLSAAISRLDKGLVINNPYTMKVKEEFSYNFEKAVRLSKEVEKMFRVTVPENEIAYICLHFQSFSERHSELEKIKAVIVCTTGLGSSRFLEQRILRDYSQSIDLIGTFSLHEFEEKISKENIQMILSTIRISNDYNKEIVMVSPLLTDIDHSKISYALQKIRDKARLEDYLIDLLDPTRIYFKNFENVSEVVDFMSKRLIQDGLAEKGVTQSIKEREKIASTALQSVAIPHCQPKFVKKSSLSILVSKSGVGWNGSKVHLVFLISFNSELQKQLKVIYHYFSKLVSKKFLKIALKASNGQDLFDEIIDYLKEEETA